MHERRDVCNLLVGSVALSNRNVRTKDEVDAETSSNGRAELRPTSRPMLPRGEALPTTRPPPAPASDSDELGSLAHLAADHERALARFLLDEPEEPSPSAHLSAKEGSFVRVKAGVVEEVVVSGRKDYRRE